MNKEFNNFRFLIVAVFVLLFFSCAEFNSNQNTDTEELEVKILEPETIVLMEEANTGSISEGGLLEITLEAESEILSEAIEDSSMPQAEDENIADLDNSWQLAPETEAEKLSVLTLCEEIGDTLGSVDESDCLEQSLRFAGTYTSHNRPIAVRDFVPEGDVEQKTKILIMGGIHGDEYSSVSIMFKWMALLEEKAHSNLLWRFVPTVNPDGLLGGSAIRQNGNGVDLNRNFPSSDWDEKAQKYWQDSTGSNPRRYPGESAASELEVQWIVEQVELFKPDVIMSVHAPYHLLDFDGPSEPPKRIGELYLHVLGVYPGSLGNYAGLNLEIPVVTLELPSAGIMPSDNEIESMWADIQDWLQESYH